MTESVSVHARCEIEKRGERGMWEGDRRARKEARRCERAIGDGEIEDDGECQRPSPKVSMELAGVNQRASRVVDLRRPIGFSGV